MEIGSFCSVRKRFAMPLWGRAPRARFNEFNEVNEFRNLRKKRIDVRRSDTPLRGAADYARNGYTLGMAGDRVHSVAFADSERRI